MSCDIKSVTDNEKLGIDAVLYTTRVVIPRLLCIVKN